MTQPPDERLTNPGDFLAPPPEPPPYGYSGLSYPPMAYGHGYNAGVDPVVAPPWADFASTPRPPLNPLFASLAFLWAIAAVGSVLAPFLPFYGFTFSTSFDSQQTNVDGWGRVSTTSATSGSHGLIWGIPLVIGAGAIMLALFGLLTQRAARWPALLGTLATVGVTTTAGCVALAWESESSQEALQSSLRAHTGSGLWVLMMTGLVTTIATILSLRAVLDWRPVAP